jgi:uncharacterized protein (TIGR02118 family)
LHKFVALYEVPERPDDFEQQYVTTHLPLIAGVPGLVRTEVAKVLRLLRGEKDLYLMAEMYFEDAAAMRSALKSQEWAAAGQNLSSIGGLELATMYTAEVLDDV